MVVVFFVEQEDACQEHQIFFFFLNNFCLRQKHWTSNIFHITHYNYHIKHSEFIFLSHRENQATETTWKTRELSCPTLEFVHGTSQHGPTCSKQTRSGVSRGDTFSEGIQKVNVDSEAKNTKKTTAISRKTLENPRNTLENPRKNTLENPLENPRNTLEKPRKPLRKPTAISFSQVQALSALQQEYGGGRKVDVDGSCWDLRIFAASFLLVRVSNIVSV